MSHLIAALSWQNVIDGHGIALALTGLAIVFSGLLVIALFIAALPRALVLWDLWRSGRKGGTAKAGAVSSAGADPDTASPEVQAALAWVAVRELEIFRLGDQQRLTFHNPRRSGMWRAMATLRNNDPSD